MEAFNLNIQNPWSPGWIIFASILAAFAIGVVILQIAVSRKYAGTKAQDNGDTWIPTGVGSVLFLMGALLGIGLTGSTLSANQDARVVHALNDKGYSHVHYNDSTNAMTASKDGTYVSGHVFDVSNSHYIVVTDK